MNRQTDKDRQTDRKTDELANRQRDREAKIDNGNSPLSPRWQIGNKGENSVFNHTLIQAEHTAGNPFVM